MASKNKPKSSKPKVKKRAHRVIGRTLRGDEVVTTNIGPSLDRMTVVGKDLPEDPDHEPRGLDASSRQIEAGMVAIARGTDALVTRVVNSAREGARDPTEHLLDLSRAYYQEETNQGTHNVQCDRCMLKSPGMASTPKAVALAQSLGWDVRVEFDHCPACKDGGMMLTGSSTALAVPPTLTAGEMILVVRLRYIVDKVDRGTSVEALLLNASRSGHRSMLSDLAQASGYDIIPLIEQVTTLIGQRGADVHPLFFSDQKKIWSFFLKLYKALEKEDRS